MILVKYLNHIVAEATQKTFHIVVLDMLLDNRRDALQEPNLASTYEQ